MWVDQNQMMRIAYVNTGRSVPIPRFRPVQHNGVVGMESEIHDHRDTPLTHRQVEWPCCLSTSSIYWFMRDGILPEPIRFGRRAVRWYASEIDAWLASRPRTTGERLFCLSENQGTLPRVWEQMWETPTQTEEPCPWPGLLQRLRFPPAETSVDRQGLSRLQRAFSATIDGLP